ncbi:hypothetical protein ACGF07_31835 [Kitasatospora sp. NPDC048194]|uniref:hypothetical protein n=1 Tax=Kitasatospora sp. NPDC048194 TaxID=3364045 RepID=UPI003712DC62
MARRPSQRASTRTRQSASALETLADLAVLAAAGWLTYRSITHGASVLPSLAVGLGLYLLGLAGLRWLLRGGR